ncbi:hypothetical protein GGI09_000267 [Coemansia sp. S100]|nr:hypothetical protein GGI09_000267 [Coemansia sp. S100]
MNSYYQLGDDVMFRGNSDTLEKLELRLDAEDVNILNGSPVFNSEFKSLKKVFIGDSYNRGNLAQAPMPTMHKLICNLATNARKLALSCETPVSGLIDLTHSSCRFENIQELAISDSKSSVCDILRLLKTLPVLSKLECNIDDLDSGFKLLKDDDLPDHVASNFGNAGKHLHTWLLPHAGGERNMKVADYLIVNYVVGSSRILGDGVEINFNKYRVLLRPQLLIELDERDIYSGNALRILSLEPYGGCAFPIAHIITFLVILDEDVTALSLLAETNVCTLVQRIKQLAPLPSKIRIRLHDFGRVPEISSFYFGSLVSQLFHLAIRIEYEHSSDTIVTMELQPDVIRNLVLFKYTCKSSVSLVVQLARQSALTLQSIDIDSEQDVDNSYVTYPRLIILKLWARRMTT